MEGIGNAADALGWGRKHHKKGHGKPGRPRKVGRPKKKWKKSTTRFIIFW